MTVTEVIWIAGVVVFFIVGMSISKAISELAHQIGEKVVKVELDSPLRVELDNHVGDLRVRVELDKIELGKIELGNHILPLEIKLNSPLEVYLDNIHPLKVAFENEMAQAPLKLALDSPMKVELEVEKSIMVAPLGNLTVEVELDNQRGPFKVELNSHKG